MNRALRFKPLTFALILGAGHFGAVVVATPGFRNSGHADIHDEGSFASSGRENFHFAVGNLFFESGEAVLDHLFWDGPGFGLFFRGRFFVGDPGHDFVFRGVAATSGRAVEKDIDGMVPCFVELAEVVTTSGKGIEEGFVARSPTWNVEVVVCSLADRENADFQPLFFAGIQLVGVGSEQLERRRPGFF